MVIAQPALVVGSMFVAITITRRPVTAIGKALLVTAYGQDRHAALRKRLCVVILRTKCSARKLKVNIVS
jgi:hypothetical protein